MKKLALFLLVPVLVFACGIVLTACGNENANGGDPSGSTTIIGTWTFGTGANTITEVKVESAKVTITYRGSGGAKVTLMADGNGTDLVSVNTTNNTFDASDNNTNNQVWTLHGSLNSSGMLVITGSLDFIRGFVSSPQNVSLTATGYEA